MSLAFLNIGTQEMMVIILVALLLFGGKKLPELARGLGRGIREFKDASEGIKREISDQINNFEKGVDEIKTDLDKEPEANKPEATPIQDFEQANASNEVTEESQEGVVEKKVPQFTAPAGTYEHKPYTTPTKDDYYSYGYNDNFANNDVPAPAAEENPATDRTTDHPAQQADENPVVDNNTKQA